MRSSDIIRVPFHRYKNVAPVVHVRYNGTYAD